MDTRTPGSKAAYVVGQRKHDGTHGCHWPGCTVSVPPAMWGCRPHWFRLPKPIRDRIWRAYQPGQEISKTPSSAYIAAAREAQDWIAMQPPPASSSAALDLLTRDK